MTSGPSTPFVFPIDEVTAAKDVRFDVTNGRFAAMMATRAGAISRR